MNIECSSCHAKYAVADERVAGRKVRIRCKRCHEPMIVDGRSVSLDGATTGEYPTASAQTLVGLKADPSSGEERLPTPVPRRKRVGKKADRAATAASQSTESAGGGEVAAAPSSPGENQDDRAADEGWFVALAQDEQPAMGLAEIVKAYRAGSIDEDTYFWREGMSDWTALEEIPDLLTVIKASDDQSQASPAPEQAPAASPASSRRGTLSARSQLRPVSSTPASDWFAHSSGPAKSQQGNGSGSRGATRTQSDPAPRASTPAPASAPTESSVMFSLGALVAAPESKPIPRSAGRRDDMLLFDLPPPSMVAPPLPFDGSQIEELARRAAAEQAAARSASTLAPAMSAASAQPPPAFATRGGRSVPLVTAMFGMIAAVSVTWALTRTPAESPRESEGASGATRTATTEGAAPTPGGPAAKETEAQGQAISELRPAGDTKPGESADKKADARGAAKSSSTDPERKRSTTSTGERSSKSSAASTESKSQEGAGGESAAASEVRLGAFSTTAAKQALDSASATSASACKKPDGPTGEGRVEVTFMPSGRASKALVGGAFAGTTVGGCIAKVFRRVLVPGFSGDPVTVSKKVVIK